MAGWISKELAVILVPIITLIAGAIIGYLAQRTGFCAVGGFRDYILFRHTRLLKGFFSIIISAFVAYLLLHAITAGAFEHFPWALTSGILSPVPGAPADLSAAAYLILALIGGIGMGVIGVYLGGCPLRQFVMTTEGNMKSLWFVVGMAVGSVLFYLITMGLVKGILKIAGL
ncbi:YeeE/YedE thiosulfate transporter family protein [uncultured Methanospirillum sp.]|uniref:YeeE/YedE thiosulfate transporter family protein n=1 Tax=uncultured Methanospirillum sp. TaxID=262503 RepID=UPI0029C622C8|nr:YeeE/YedE thiosulfate transporter family protein [uncultured Methanospirillum sp.]